MIPILAWWLLVVSVCALVVLRHRPHRHDLAMRQRRNHPPLRTHEDSYWRSVRRERRDR